MAATCRWPAPCGFDAHDGRVHRTEVHVRDRVPPPKESGNEHRAPDQDLSSRITVVFGAAAHRAGLGAAGDA